MTRRKTRWVMLAAWLTFAASMVLPVQSLGSERYMPGYGLAYLSIVGVFFMVPLCWLGAFANVGFVVVGIVGLVRANSVMGRGRRGIFVWACIVCGAMLLAWLGTGLEVAGGPVGLRNGITLGGAAWVLSGILLVWGCWGLKGPDFQVERMGFEVIPVAKRADAGKSSPHVIP